MTSEEAIQELYNEREYLLGEKVNNKTKNWHNDITHYDNINHCLLTIKQDLERLEKLEKENQELKEKCKILEENQETVLTTLESSVQENVKLKKAIEILKDELEISFEDTTQEGNGYWVVLQNCGGEEEVVINFNTSNNYELLKEVLENE